MKIINHQKVKLTFQIIIDIISTRVKLSDNDSYNIDFFEISLEEDNNIDSQILFYQTCIYNSIYIIFMIDITKEDSFINIKNLISKIKFEKYTKSILLLNKIDLQSEKEISDNEIIEFLELNPTFIKREISLKTLLNYNEFINDLNENLKKDKSKILTHFISEVPNSTKILAPNLPQIKIILLGDSQVGKTAFINRYCKNSFLQVGLATFGMEDEKKILKIKDKMYRLKIWDTAGQERFRSIPKRYYQNVDGILLLFDLNQRQSFDNILNWIKSINENTRSRFTNESVNLTITLIGNKIDLERKVSHEEINKLVHELNISYFEVSCKLNINIYDSITYNIFECIKKLNNFNLNFSNSTIIDNLNQDEIDKGGCCKKK